MSVAYHPDFGGVVRYRFETLPEHPDGQVRDTIARILSYVRADVDHPLIQEDAREALRLGAAPGRSYAQQAIAGVFQKVKRHIRFKQDEEIAAALEIDDPRKANIVEVIIRPVDQAMLIRRMPQGVEDCDGFEGYASCLLAALGIDCALVTVSAEPKEPYRFTHVYLAAYADGQRIPVDFSHGPHPGWECPNTGRLEEWPVQQSVCMRMVSALSPLLAVVAIYLTYRLATQGRLP